MTYSLTICLVLLFLASIMSIAKAADAVTYAKEREHSDSTLAIGWFLALFVIIAFALNVNVLYNMAKQTYVDSCGLAERP